MRPNEEKSVWPFWPALTTEERELVTRQSVSRHLSPGAILLDEHSDSCGMVLVQKGRLCLYMIASEGRAVMLHSVEAGESFLLGAMLPEADRPLGLLLEADCDSLVLTLSAELTDYLLDHNPRLMQQAYRRVCAAAQKTLRTVQRMLFAGIPARVALALLEECRRQGREDLRITQEKLAREAGSSREVITRTLRDFAARGLVRVGHGKIQVLDAGALHSLAEGKKETEG